MRQLFEDYMWANLAYAKGTVREKLFARYEQDGGSGDYKEPQIRLRWAGWEACAKVMGQVAA